MNGADHGVAELSISFDAQGNGRLFTGFGWSEPEPTHRWTVGGASRINLPPMGFEQGLSRTKPPGSEDTYMSN